MRSPRTGPLALPIVAALLLAFALRMSLRTVGENLVPLLQRGPGAGTLWPLRGLLLHAILAFVAVSLWRRAPRDRRALIFGATVAAASLVISYLASGEPSTRGDFHGLLTPEPNSTVVEGAASRAPLRYELDAHGFRKPGFAVAKAEGTLRIALIGGSFVFGLGVTQEQTLSSTLEAVASARWPARRFEALNLGISGDNLPSHLRVVELAQTVLDADVSVLCLLLPAELSRWDGQDERRGPTQVDAFHLVSWALGMQTARFLFRVGESNRNFTTERLALFNAQIERLRAFRHEHGEKPLLVLGYEELAPELRARFAALPGVVVLRTPERRDGLYLPGDGHPSAAGNAAFAEAITEALEGLPALAASAPR